MSYDQVTVTEDRKSSLLYWTIVGAYVIKGTENEVQTFVDTAVFDVKTGRLMFRAPGTDTLQARSTAIEASESVRKSRVASFSLAVDDMTANLLTELDTFEMRLKEELRIADVRWKDGRGGGGSAGIFTLGALCLALLARRRRILT